MCYKFRIIRPKKQSFIAFLYGILLRSAWFYRNQMCFGYVIGQCCLPKHKCVQMSIERTFTVYNHWFYCIKLVHCELVNCFEKVDMKPSKVAHHTLQITV